MGAVIEKRPRKKDRHQHVKQGAINSNKTHIHTHLICINDAVGCHTATTCQINIAVIHYTGTPECKYGTSDGSLLLNESRQRAALRRPWSLVRRGRCSFER